MHPTGAELAAPVGAAAAVLVALVARGFRVGNAEFVLLAAVLGVATLALARPRLLLARERFVSRLVEDVLSPRLDGLTAAFEGRFPPAPREVALDAARYPGMAPDALARLGREYDRVRFLLCTLERVAPQAFERVARLLELGPPEPAADGDGDEEPADAEPDAADAEPAAA